MDHGFEVLVLGIAQDAGFPHIGCRRACCAPAWADPSRRRSPVALGIVERRTSARWLVEATPDLPLQLQRLLVAADPGSVRPRPVLDGVFLTHAHLGHYLGLAQFGREALGARGLPVYALPRLRGFLEANGPWGQLVDLGNIELRGLAAEEPVEPAPGLTVTPILVPHRGEYSETAAFRITGPERSILFLPDIDRWEEWDRRLEDEIAAVDIAFLDATFFDASELGGQRATAEIPHPTVRATMARLDACPAELRSRVRFLHFNHSNPLLAPGAARDEVESRGYRCAEEGGSVGI